MAPKAPQDGYSDQAKKQRHRQRREKSLHVVLLLWLVLARNLETQSSASTGARCRPFPPHLPLHVIKPNNTRYGSVVHPVEELPRKKPASAKSGINRIALLTG
jgi:hypothetical protein